jgi:aspartate kinase
MKLVVKKFGGTSVGDIARIKNVAALIKDFKERNPDTEVVAVVSAMSGETNKLISLAKSCVEKPEPRELDVLVATGEQVTIALLSMALIDLGLPAQSFSGLQANIATDTHFTNAHIKDIQPDNLRAVLKEGKIPVVAGFQGVDPVGNLTTLGRGGSDITAVAIAAALKADACYIYTDVEGVFTTDPRICKNARLMPRVSHEEMLEMASLGAKVLHPRSVYFAMTYNVPLVVLSTFNPHGGATWIVREEELMEKPIVTGITHRTDETKITLKDLTGGTKTLTALFSEFAAQGLFIDMITQAHTSHGATNVSFTVPEDASSQAIKIVERCTQELSTGAVEVDREIAKVSVVGIGMRYHSGVAAKVFQALAKEGIEVQMISTSEIKISVAIPRKYCELAVRSLHEAFIEHKPSISTEH